MQDVEQFKVKFYKLWLKDQFFKAMFEHQTICKLQEVSL